MAADPPEKKGDLSRYQIAAAHLSPALREELYRAFARAKLTENDPLWAVLAATVEIHQAFLREWQAKPNGQAGGPFPSAPAALPRDFPAWIQQAFRDVDDNRHRQTDELKQVIREALPPQRWYHQADWQTALTMLVLFIGFAAGFFLAWPLAKDQANAEALKQVEALTKTLRGQ